MGAAAAALVLLICDVACQKHPAEEAAVKPPAEACDTAVKDDPSPSGSSKARSCS